MTKNLTNNVLQGLLIAAAVAAVLPVPDLAWANGNDLQTSVESLQTNIANIPNLLSAAFYIGGILLVGAGLLKLRAHSENPGQTPLGQGVGRIAVGGGLLAIPAFGQWVLNTVGNTGQQGAQFQAITPLTQQ